MKIKINRIIFLTIIFIFLITFSNIVCASDLTKDINISQPKTHEFETVGQMILGIVQVVGILASVIALMIMGIKYMLGSIEEKAEYKNSFKIYIIGALLVFGISAFAKLIYNVIQGIQ